MTGSQPIKNMLKWPLRAAAARFGAHRKDRAEHRLWVLMYHRVLPVTDTRYDAEEPGMVVTPETFEMHLKWLRDHFELVQLRDWIAASGSSDPLPSRACAITFDDGWRDNFEFALPLLRQYSAPATVFAVSHMIGTETQFWPNRLAALLRQLPENWREQSALQWLQQFGDIPSAGDCDREQAAAVIARAKSLPDNEIEARLDDAEALLGDAATTAPPLLSWDQLRTMCDSGLVDVGSHTCRHTRLTDALNEQQMLTAICDSRNKIGAELNRDVSVFCYPNGDSNAYADEIVRSHYQGAVTTSHGINTAFSDPYRLARISLHQGNSDSPLKLAARLSGWRGV